MASNFTNFAEDSSGGIQRPPSWQVWGLGLLSVSVISSCAVLGIGIMPLVSRRLYHKALTYLVGLGVGSLSGSAVFHLLPQAFALPHDSDINHHYLSIAWFVIAGIYLFFFTDKLLKLIIEHRKVKKRDREQQQHRLAREMSSKAGLIDMKPSATDLNVVVVDSIKVHENGRPGPGATPTTDASTNPSTDQEMLLTPISDNRQCCNTNECNPDGACKAAAAVGSKQRVTYSNSGPTIDGGGDTVICATNGKEDDADADERMSWKSLTCAEHERQAHGVCAHDHDVHFEHGDSVIATVAWMIIFGDGLHNLVDGLSIGAAFTSGPLTGFSVSLAVLAEEFPHELGDVAILVNAGMSLRQALTYNLLSALSCYVGFVIGVLTLEELFSLTPYVFAISGGMFLYISLASMIPEMNQAVARQLGRSRWRALLVLGLQSAGVFTGLILMFLLARFGGDISLNE